MKLKRFGDFVATGPGGHEGSAILLHLQAPELDIRIRTEDLVSPENNPHCTIISGVSPLYSIPDVGPVMLAVRSCVDGPLVLSNPSLFQGKDSDVLKMDVSGEIVTAARSACLHLKHVEKFPTFVPHCTVAYVKKGAGDKYLSSMPREVTATVTYVSFSSFDGTKSFLFIQ